ncbi:MAG TPA: GntR family transcriptional regulator [Streptosporangiaceae bacterium]
MRKPPKRAALAARELRELIADELTPGDRLPSEQELARRLDVSRVTVRGALGQLWVEGLVTRRWGVGTFVRDRSAWAAPMAQTLIDVDELGSLPAMITEAGHTPSLPHFAAEETPCPPDVAQSLDLAEGAPVWRIERCLAVDGTPAIVLRDHVPTMINGHPLDPKPLRRVTGDLPTLCRRASARLVRMEARLGAEAATSDVAALLTVTPGTALVTGHQIAYDESGAPVIDTRMYYRTDVYALVVVRTVPS